MDKKTHFEFDAQRQVIIKYSDEEMPKIMRKNTLTWSDFGPKDEIYAKAIFLGQGCWERLNTITEEDANRILSQWGYYENT